MRDGAKNAVQGVVGFIGAAGATLCGIAWWKVVHSPGDDNPIGMFAAWGFLLALLPAWGLIRWLRDAKLETAGKLWLALSGLACVALVPMMLVLEVMFIGR